MQLISLTSLAAYHKFEADGSGVQGGNALVENGTPTYVAGKLGNAAQLLRASTQYFSGTGGANPEFIMGTGVSMTGLAWVYPLNHTSCVYFRGTGTTAAGHEYGMVVNASTGLTCRFSNGTSNILPNSPVNSILLSAWNLCVAQFNASTGVGTAQVFNASNLAGTSLASPATATVSGTSVIWDNGNPFQVGLLGLATAKMDGIVDSLAIFKRLLSAAEIIEYFNEGNGREYPWQIFRNSLHLRQLCDTI